MKTNEKFMLSKKELILKNIENYFSDSKKIDIMNHVDRRRVYEFINRSLSGILYGTC